VTAVALQLVNTEMTEPMVHFTQRPDLSEFRSSETSNWR
jgi:hypothetical protein